MIPFIFLIIGSFITIGAGYFEYRSKLKDKQDALDNEVKRSNEYQHIISTQHTVIDNSQKIIDLQQEVITANKKLASVQENTLNNVTGGSNIPKLDLFISGYGISGKLTNSSKYPVRNVSVKLQQTIYELFGSDSQSNNPNTKRLLNFEIGDLNKTDNRPVMNLTYPKEYNKVMYIFTVRWLNGYYRGGLTCVIALDGKLQIKDCNITLFPPKLGTKLKGAVIVNEKPATVVISKNSGEYFSEPDN